MACGSALGVSSPGSKLDPNLFKGKRGPAPLNPASSLQGYVVVQKDTITGEIRHVEAHARRNSPKIPESIAQSRAFSCLIKGELHCAATSKA
jgi:hypothetical protein